MNKRKCECCGAIYATGKNYGEFWQEIDFGKYYDLETKGLCEFCNPNIDNKWYIKDKKCHSIKNQK